MQKVGRVDDATGISAAMVFALVVVVAAVVFLIAAPRAAADYSVAQCDPWNSEATWQPFGTTGFSIWGTNECSTTGVGLRLDTTYNGQGTGYTGNGSGLAWRFIAPAGTSFASASMTLHYGNDGGFAAAAFDNGPSGFNVFQTCQTPSSCWASPTATSATLFDVRLQCFKSPNCHSTWSYAWANNFHATIDDRHAPTISADGPLFSGGIARGNQTITATAADVGGGVRSIRVYVNGVLSKTDEEWCLPDRADGQYTHLKPCPDLVTHQIAVDTQSDPGWTNGPNDVVICSADVGPPTPGGQNVSSPCFRRTVDVDNSCPGSGGNAGAHLDAGADLGGKLADRAAITSSQDPVIRGSLKDGSGSPVPGATVCVYQTVDLPDASRELATTVTTQSNGRFATRLEAGPSRDLDLVYRYNERVLSHQVDLDSAVIPTLDLTKRTLANGQAAHFAGRLPGPGADGRAVALQARVGKKWRTFKQLRTDSDGRFRGKYRFTQTIGRVRYTFRALVKRQNGYPYEPGSSPKRKLTVYG